MEEPLAVSSFSEYNPRGNTINAVTLEGSGAITRAYVILPYGSGTPIWPSHDFTDPPSPIRHLTGSRAILSSAFIWPSKHHNSNLPLELHFTSKSCTISTIDALSLNM
jgi:alpha-D-ribose 1-methylphosphonate 5-phosphate C-P lyase